MKEIGWGIIIGIWIMLFVALLVDMRLKEEYIKNGYTIHIDKEEYKCSKIER